MFLTSRLNNLTTDYQSNNFIFLCSVIQNNDAVFFCNKLKKRKMNNENYIYIKQQTNAFSATFALISKQNSICKCTYRGPPKTIQNLWVSTVIIQWFLCESSVILCDFSVILCTFSVISMWCGLTIMGDRAANIKYRQI